MQFLLWLACFVGKFVILPIGLAMLAAAVYFGWDTRAWLARSVEAQGSVIEMVRVRDSDTGSLSFAPLVRFITADGNTIEFQSTVQSNPPGYRAGQNVTVLYDPAKPNSAALSGLFSIWGVPVILGIIGVVFTAFGLAAAILSRRLL